MQQFPTTRAGKPSSGSRLNRQFAGFETLPTKGTTERHVTSLAVTASVLIFPTLEFTHPIRLPRLPETNTRGGRTWCARWTEKSRQDAGGTKTGLAPGERGGGNEPRGFFHRDDVVGGNIFELIGLAAGPANFYCVGFGVVG